MGHKTLFAVMIRVIGLHLLVTAAATIAMFSVNLIMSDSLETFGYWIYGAGVSGLVHLVAGLFCFFGGQKVANLAYPNNRTYCRNCGWGLTAAATYECTECGVSRAGNETTDVL